MCYYLLEEHTEDQELVWRAEIELRLFQQYFTPCTLPLNQGKSKATSVQIHPKHTHHMLNNSYP
jgi:hypothetical protein